MPDLLIANLFSFGSACFTVASSRTEDPRRTYRYQVWQCLFYAAAAYFFGVYSTIVMMLVNALRNGLVAAGRYTLGRMTLCAVFSLVVGFAVNGGSLPGCISVLMTVYYTISSFFLRNPQAVKLNVAIDLSLWFVYDLMVTDIPSGIVDLVSVLVAVITLFRIRRRGSEAGG